MKPLIPTILLLLSNTVACSTNPAPKTATVDLPIAKVVDQVVYLRGGPPEITFADFTQAPAANDYFGLLLEGLQQRNGATDAQTALKAGEFYLLLDEPSFPHRPHTMNVIHSRQGSHQQNSQYSTEAFVNCYINRLQGMGTASFYGGHSVDPGHVERYLEYNKASVEYAASWNDVMFPACAQRTGDFKKPPDQRPPF